MQTSEQGLALIKQYEGFRAMPYLCPAGKLTVGYGHVIAPGEDSGAGITPEQAESLLIQDSNWAEQAVNRLVTVALTQNQFDALVALTYNIGAGAFEKSTLLRLLNNGDTEGAAAQFPRWAYANGQKLDGLARRRAAEQALFSQSA